MTSWDPEQHSTSEDRGHKEIGAGLGTRVLHPDRECRPFRQFRESPRRSSHTQCREARRVASAESSGFTVTPTLDLKSPNIRVRARTLPAGRRVVGRKAPTVVLPLGDTPCSAPTVDLHKDQRPPPLHHHVDAEQPIAGKHLAAGGQAHAGCRVNHLDRGKAEL